MPKAMPTRSLFPNRVHADHDLGPSGDPRGGAKAANVFWQVGTSATLGTTSAFKGTIMADQSISLTTGATLNGRALARVAAVTLEADVITTPAP